jgi:phosphoenolpyruvate-protein phosphotransferase/dihydroxyacetone kinase phosphotransfer subunit
LVGIVIVSHSAALAAGVVELARGMGPAVPMAAAGGLDLPGQPVGTDAALILAAIEQVYSDDGVAVLVDLGSAVLSAEMALEMLPEERRAHVAVSEAPLVEGAVAAAVQAQQGRSLAQVLAEARGALAAKGLGAPSPAAPARESVHDLELLLTVRHPLGLHLRPASRFVATASRFTGATIQAWNSTTGRGPADAKSLSELGALGVRQDHRLRLAASGPEAGPALSALMALAEADFGDEEAAKQAGPPNLSAAGASVGVEASGGWQGVPVAPGIAIGPACFFTASAAERPTQDALDPAGEWQRLEQALAATGQEIEAARASVARRAGPAAAAIFEAQALLLRDEALLGPARQRMEAEHQSAAAAWWQAVQAMARQYAGLEDEYQRARGADIEAVGQQVLLNLLGRAARVTEWQGAGILLADDLSPAEAARLDPHKVLGIALAAGGPTSHSAILARALGVPAVAGLGPALLSLSAGTALMLDGTAGRLWPNPSSEQAEDYAQRAAAQQAGQARARAAADQPAVTRDGRRVAIAANIGTPAEAGPAVALGAEGVGLFRSEFLFLDRPKAPDEDEQYAAYRAAAEALAGRPLVIRTLDVGGDKRLPFMDMPAEANPFLGVRGLRLCLARPDFFKVQLRAVVRAAAMGRVRVMFPMVALPAELRAAKRLLAEARAEVAGRGQPTPEHIELGIMVEIPATALQAERFAPEVDFLSIGTNDLTQYTLAAERGNAQVAALGDGLHPAVLHLIALTVSAAHAHGRQAWVSVCGELAADPLAARLLVGLGVDELSMMPAAIPQTKAIVRGLRYETAQAQARAALALESAEAVRATFKSP